MLRARLTLVTLVPIRGICTVPSLCFTSSAHFKKGNHTTSPWLAINLFDTSLSLSLTLSLLLSLSSVSVSLSISLPPSLLFSSLSFLLSPREFKTKNDEMTKRLAEFTKSNADSLQQQKVLTQVGLRRDDRGNNSRVEGRICSGWIYESSLTHSPFLSSPLLPVSSTFHSLLFFSPLPSLLFPTAPRCL